VIRQVALSNGIGQDFEDPARAAPITAPTQPSPTPTGEELIDIIDAIAPEQAPQVPNPGSPGLLSGRSQGLPTREKRQPEPMDQLRQPAVDLVDGSTRGGGGANGNWVYLNGQWVELPGRKNGPSNGAEVNPDSMVTQRVIRVPLKPLLAGKQSVNIVIRPGDVIRVPGLESGNVYMGGTIARPGSFQLPANGRLTLMRAVFSAGGLAETSIPERVDLTRMVGRDRQATIRLNLREIAKGTQPDIYLKADDQINFGTNFWALPLALVRNGFRASYGFGFLLDRNFGNDVFGIPPGSTNSN
jgi:hypothetical protein